MSRISHSHISHLSSSPTSSPSLLSLYRSFPLFNSHVQSTGSPYSSTSSTRKQNKTYLLINNSLLEPRPNHSRAPLLLTPTPNTRSIRRLQLPLLLARLDALLESSIETPRCVLCLSVRGTDGRRILLGVRVVGWHWVLGHAAWGAGCEGAEGGRAEECAGAGAREGWGCEHFWYYVVGRSQLRGGSR